MAYKLTLTSSSWCQGTSRASLKTASTVRLYRRKGSLWSDPTSSGENTRSGQIPYRMPSRVNGMTFSLCYAVTRASLLS